MKMKLLLFLCCVLTAKAEDQHEDLYVNGCSDSDGENMYTLETEEDWYADFKKGEGVYPLPPFVDPNRFPDDTYQLAVANQQICKSNLKNSRIGMKDLLLEEDAPSSLMIYHRDKVELDVKNTLICHVSGFYPAPVRVNWTRNGQLVTEGTSINVPFPSKDGTFTQISKLDFIPKIGDVYSCEVEHEALKKQMNKIWDVKVETPDPSIGPAVFCGVGLTIGLLGVAVGTFFLIKGNECS